MEEGGIMSFTDEENQSKCSHIIGLAFYRDELDIRISSDNLDDVRENYEENDIDWFKHCPYCGYVIRPIDRGEMIWNI